MKQMVLRYYDDIHEGMSGEFEKTVTDSDVRAFADVSGDRNPLHLDDEYAKTTIFRERIGHGMLTASFISATFAEILPGPGWIYLDQSLQFLAPVKIGDTVTTTVVARRRFPEKKLVEFITECSVNGVVVLKGTATLKSPKPKT